MLSLFTGTMGAWLFMQNNLYRCLQLLLHLISDSMFIVIMQKQNCIDYQAILYDYDELSLVLV